MNFYEFSMLISENTVTQWLKQKSQEFPVRDLIKITERRLAPYLSSFAQKPVAKWLVYLGIIAYSSSSVVRSSAGFSYGREPFDFITSLIYHNIDQPGHGHGNADYLTATLDRNNIDFDPNVLRKLNNLNYSPNELIHDAEQWHQTIAKRRVKSDEQGRPLIEFPDGWKWVSLDKDYCEKEGKAMGHCGNVQRKSGDNILSLRDPKGWSHLTFVVNNKVLGESKAPKNNKWTDYKPELKPYIIKLLESDYIQYIQGGGYKPEANFYLKDLGPEERKALLDKKPQLGSFLYYALDEFADAMYEDDPKPNDMITRLINLDSPEDAKVKARIRGDLLIIENLSNLIKRKLEFLNLPSDKKTVKAVFKDMEKGSGHWKWFDSSKNSVTYTINVFNSTRAVYKGISYEGVRNWIHVDIDEEVRSSARRVHLGDNLDD